MDYLEFIARVTLHIPDKGQVMVRYYGLYANAHRGKVRKVDISPLALRMSGEEFKPVPSKGWAAMIRKVKEIQSFRKWPIKEDAGLNCGVTVQSHLGTYDDIS